MIRYILIIIVAIALTSCGTSTKSLSTNRGLMLLDQTELPRNAKFVSPRYQQKLKKSQKKHQRAARKRYKRAAK